MTSTVDAGIGLPGPERSGPASREAATPLIFRPALRGSSTMCTVPLVLVTGISGSGKFAVCGELRRRGYEAHDTDRDGNAVWVNRKTGQMTAMSAAPEVKPPEWLEEQEWRVVPRKVEALAKRADDRRLFLCGSTANEKEVWHLFSRGDLPRHR